MGNTIFVIQILFGQPMPKVDKPIGIVYNDDNGLILVFAETLEEVKMVVIEDEEFDIITIEGVAYEGYTVDSNEIAANAAAELDFNADTKDLF